LTNTRQELDNQQAEKARIEYVILVMLGCTFLTYDLFRKLHVEADEKLQSIYHQLLQAGADKHESDREAKLKETLASLQGIFPGPWIFFHFLAILLTLRSISSGVRGRIVDLCKPIQRKYETAVSVVLGRNIDAIVVDEEKTAIDCIEVTLYFVSCK
jgi:structural maintenance of chromosome 1